MQNFSNFSYQMTTEIVFGKDTELQTGKLIKKYGGTKVMIVMDGGGFIKRNGLFDKVVGSLAGEGLSHIELGGVPPNASLSVIYQGLELAKKENIDFLIAIGGGSTIDTTKGIALGMEYDGDLWDFYTQKATPKSSAPMGVISTIAASGSETSVGSVIRDDVHTNTKSGVRSLYNLPKFVIMNPELTYTVPLKQTAIGAADMFSHVTGSYFSREDSYLGDRFSESTMRTAVKFGPIALKDPTNYEARAELLLAASFCHNGTCRIGRGRAFSGCPEQMSSFFNASHGEAEAPLMPAKLQYMLDHDEATIPKLVQFAVNVFDVTCDPLRPRDVAQEGIHRLRAWLKELGMPATMSEQIGRPITDEEMDRMVEAAPYRADGYTGEWSPFNKEDIRNIYESIR